MIEWLAALVLVVPGALCILALALPLRLNSRGPLFYSQVRLGRHGRPFRIYKLRTMTHGCERATGPVWASESDPRVTPLGRWLRYTHLDELPQLWNVLRGDMGLIGPRPERPEIAAQIRRKFPSYSERLLVRPGITGLAQMRLPADKEIDLVDVKLAYDLHYIRSMSLDLDARIAMSTLLHLIGWAATAASRRIVGPLSAPALPLEHATVVTREVRVPQRRRADDVAGGTTPTGMVAAASS